jgi:hypothetical protein
MKLVIREEPLIQMIEFCGYPTGQCCDATGRFFRPPVRLEISLKLIYPSSRCLSLTSRNPINQGKMSSVGLIKTIQLM